jgi:hypothetical protein
LGNISKRTKNSPLIETQTIPEWLIIPTLLFLIGFLFRDFIFSNDMLYGSDTLSLGYMAREFYANSILKGIFPLWNPYILGGTPFLDSLAGGDSLYPPSALLLLVLDPHRALGWKLLIHILMAGLFMYQWIKKLHLSTNSAFIAAIAYSLSPIMVTLTHGGQDGKIFIIALTPLLFSMCESFISRPSSRSFGLLSFTIGLAILTTHFQMAYFLFLAVGAYACFRTLNQKSGHEGIVKYSGRFARVNLLGLFGLAAILGLALSAIQFFPASSYVLEHSRRTATTTAATTEEARIYSSSWSLHPEEIVGLVIPEFVGVSNANDQWSQNTYWGRNGFKGNHEYLGLVILVFAAISLRSKRRKTLRNFMLSLAALALLFSLGEHTPIWGLFYKLLPGISLFRAPSLSIFLVGFSVTTLMALGLEEAWTLGDAGKGKSIWKNIWRFMLGVITVLLLGFIFSKSGTIAKLWTSFLYPDISDTGRQILYGNNFRIAKGFLYSTLIATCLLAVLAGVRRRLCRPQIAAVAIATIIIVDLIRVDTSFIKTIDFKEFHTAGPTIQLLVDRQKEETPFRVLSLAGLNGQDVRPGMFGLELAGGHHPNDLARYRELIGMTGSGLPMNLLTNHNILSLLNVRYILWPKQLGKPSDQGLPVNIVGDLREIPQLGAADIFSESIYTFPDLERARLVHDAIIIPDENNALDFVLSDQFDPSTQVVVSEPLPFQMQPLVKLGQVSWVSRNTNDMRLEVITESNAMLVLSDNWFPGWKSRVNGQLTEVLRVNHSLRGIPLAKGVHSVDIYYESSIVTLSMKLTMLALSILCVLVIWNPVKYKCPAINSDKYDA